MGGYVRMITILESLIAARRVRDCNLYRIKCNLYHNTYYFILIYYTKANVIE